MGFQEILKTIKKSWNWIWNSDSILSWIVALVVIFIFIKFIFFPSLSIILGTQLPLAGVESSSMDHSSLKDCIRQDSRGLCIRYSQEYKLCGKNFDKHSFFNLNSYWENCGDWYENIEISKQEFENFPMKNGFSRGDIIIVWGRFKPKIGDIIIFKANAESKAPRPIIHRIVKIENNLIQTKGDHNERQLLISDPGFTDETTIKQEQIIGKAIFKIPLLGYVKIWATELWQRILG